MKSLELTPNINIKIEGIMCTLNVNMQTNDSLTWLKRKLKSFLLNNITFYFRSSVNSKAHSLITLNKLYQQAAEKYMYCCYFFKRFHTHRNKTNQEVYDTFDFGISRKLVDCIYAVIRALFRYLVCNVHRPVFEKEDYQKFFKYSLKFFLDRFEKNKNYFKDVYKLLRKKHESKPEFT